ncbi:MULTISPECIES: DUF4912 domain-containing protein [unclassified Cyanobium]|uniref:DUF4912 domain-containing protein n=1 Tax=unclassified Cyanobium TaxID=2627006 RepID=UPI0020CDCFA0|nr:MULTISPECIES: DUF4912 domain-containing protein [unclassified Cyanobium]MCP9859269.1 DUF4912 domain-containing protein [Cyanobium sp. Cruz-8H5]MCP9866705.1 DUF4912 domain-containing protein [Cyanobium sp. Cruz-8D1]
MRSRPSRFKNILSQPLRRLGALARTIGLGGRDVAAGPESSPAQDPPSAAPFQEPAAASPALERPSDGGGGTSWVAFLPRDPQWSQVRWAITPADRSQAQADGATQLCLRVADVTGLDGGSTHPHTLQEVVVESQASEWYLPVPLSGRDYRVELGFRKGGSGGWISLAFSATAHVPVLDSQAVSVPDPFVAFSMPPAIQAALAPVPSREIINDLHERLYQSATSPWRRLGRGSETFHESDSAAGLQGDNDFSASGAGPWASGRSGSGIGGVAARQRSFWLVADAELIVYGATDPSARLSIGGEAVPLSADGTFRLQVPFRDGQQLYPIEALAADGEQKRSITMEFRRTTPHANVNPKDEAQSEWF